MKTATNVPPIEGRSAIWLGSKDCWLALSPLDVNHLLLLLDPLHVSERVLASVLNFTKERWLEVTVMHGGRLRSSLPSSAQIAFNQNSQDLSDLTCVYWQLRNGHQHVEMSQRVPQSVQQVLTDASECEVDLIMVPEALFGPFKHFLAADGGTESPRSLTCPIVVITEAAIGSAEDPISDISWFR